MLLRKLAVIGVAAMAVAATSAKADNLAPLRKSLYDMNINAAGDAPYGGGGMQAQQQAASASVVWEGRLRLGFGIVHDSTGSIGAVASTPVFDAGGVQIGTTGGSAGQTHAVDIRSVAHLGALGKTQTPLGEFGVNFAVQSAVGSNLIAAANGENFSVGTDGIFAYWKMAPYLSVTGGQVALIGTGYSWDSNASNWFFASTGGGILGFKSSPDDPVGLRFAYADGPFGVSAQVYDGANANNVSAFGGMAKASFKMDEFGADVGAGISANPAAPANWSVFTGLGYTSSAFSAGAAVGTGGGAGMGITTTPASVFGKVNLFDSARIEAGMTRDFTAAGNNTVIGAGMYYTPLRQFTVGLEGSYVMNALGAANGDGSFGAGIVSAVTF